MNDTPPEVTVKMAEMIQAKSPSERANMGWSMYETSKLLVIRAIMEQNPGISKGALRREIFLKFYGSDFDPETRDKIIKHLEEER